VVCPEKVKHSSLDSFTRMLAAHVTMRCRRLKTVLLLWLEARDVGSPVGEICPVQIGDELGCHPDRVVDIVHCSGRVVPPPRNSVPAELWVPSKAILRQVPGTSYVDRAHSYACEADEARTGEIVTAGQRKFDGAVTIGVNGDGGIHEKEARTADHSLSKEGGS